MSEFGLERAFDDPRVARIFDGTDFRERLGDGRLTVTPGLVDAGAGIGGYRERLTDPLLDAPRAIIRLLREWGISGIRVSSSSWAERDTFGTLLRKEPGRFLSVAGGGPILTDAEPTSERQCWITTPAELTRAIARSAFEGVGWLPIQTDQQDFAQAAILEAHQRGLRVALRGPVTIASPLREGDLFLGVGNLVRSTNLDRALEILLAWADTKPEGVIGQVSKLAERGVALTSELLTLYRNVFVREALNAPFLEENVAILPHVRWLLQMRRGAGYISGRSALREYTGLAEPTRGEARGAAKGWQTLVEAVGHMASNGIRILPASTAPQMTQLPGLGLKEELGVLVQAGVPLARVLAAATDAAWLGLDSGGQMLASSESPENSERFLATLAPFDFSADLGQAPGSTAV